MSSKKTKAPPKTVPQILNEAADFFEERNGQYGSAYKRHGDIMAGMFPDGVELKTPADFYRYHILVLQVIKLTRVAVALEVHKTHTDSNFDNMVYSAMALEEDSNE